MSFALPLADALAYIGRTDLAKTAADRPDNYTFESKDATLVSGVQALLKNAGADTHGLCDQHARFWGIDAEWQAAKTKLASYQPAEPEDQVFALVGANGAVRKYAAYDRQSVFDAALQFYDERHLYPLAWRKTASARLLARAQTFDTYLPESIDRYLHKAAGLGYPTAESAEQLLVERLNRVPQVDEHQELTTKLAQVLELMTERQDLRQDEQFVKSAVEAIADYDTQTGMVGAYADGLSLPEELLADELVLPEMAKTAAADPACQLVNGLSLRLSDLTVEALDAVDPQLVKLSSDQLLEVLPTLPRGDADLLSRLTIQKVAADPNVFTDDVADQMQAETPVDRMESKAVPVAPAATNTKVIANPVPAGQSLGHKQHQQLVSAGRKHLSPYTTGTGITR